jgi:hypothetical protein
LSSIFITRMINIFSSIKNQGFTSARKLKSPSRDYLISKDRRIKDDQEEIQNLASKIEPKLAKAILAAFDKQGEKLKADDIVKALERGDINAVLKLIDEQAFDVGMGPARDHMHEAVKAGGAISAKALVLGGVEFHFDTLNPKLVSWLQNYELNLIKQINTSTKEAIRDKLLTGMTAGTNPKQVATQIKQVVGLTPKMAKAVENFRSELETFHTKQSAGGWKLNGKIDSVNGTQVFRPDKDGNPKDGILNRRLRDFRYDKTLASAIETGKPLTPEQIDKMVSAYARKYLAYRSRNIARTEALRATNVGVTDAWRQAIEAGKVQEQQVRRRWIVSKDERTCLVCSPIPKMNPEKGVKMDTPFQTPDGAYMQPPIHPSCRCTTFIRMYEPEQLED